MVARSVNTLPYKISINYDENEREEKLQKVKMHSFSEIWSVFYDEEGDDKINSIDNFKKYLSEEADAIKRAHYPEDGMHVNAYESNPPKERDKGAAKHVRKKYSSVAQNFFKAEEEYFKNHDAAYIEYLADKREAERILDERERNIRNKELQEKYKDHIAAMQRCEETYAEFEKYETTINWLNSLPKSVLANLRDVQKQCEERGCLESFDKAARELFLYSEFMPAYKDKECNDVVNEYQLAIGSDSNVITRAIKNINGSGMEVTFVNNGMAIIRCGKNITEDQLKALADYCYKYDADIASFGSLKETQVVDNEGKEVGVIEEVFKKALDENKNSHNRETNMEIEAVEEDFQIDTNSGYFTQFIPKDKITVKADDIKIFGKKIGSMPTATGLDMGKAEAAIKKFAGNVIVKEHRLGKTILSVYASEDDIEDDCKYDDKGKMKHTKRFAVVFSHSKPEASIYLGSKEKMTADLARVVLDTYKAQGYKYFTFPPLNTDEGFGKEGQVAFLKATVGTRMPILLKGPNGKGCDISANDIETVLAGIKDDKEFNHTPNQKIEYLMRWHEQLEKYIKTTGKTDLNDLADKFKQQAQFTHFERSFKSAIDDEIKKGITGNLDGQKQWDDVDVIAAQYAYTEIVESIKNGHLGGKRYNPLDVAGNQKLVLEEFNRLREKRRPIIKKEIDNNIASMSNGDSDNKINDPVGKAIEAVRKAYNDGYIALKEDLSANGVDISMKNRGALVRYKPNKERQHPSIERIPHITPRYQERR